MKILKFKKLSSTQEKAKELIKENKNNSSWIVIFSKEQTKGKGRKGNKWYSPEGGLYFSIILPPFKIKKLENLTILTAYIIAKKLKDNFNLEPLIKLPNDILINGKKICGILTENTILGERVASSIIGVGINTNLESFPKELKNKATSLKIETKKEVDNEKLLREIITELKKNF